MKKFFILMMLSIPAFLFADPGFNIKDYHVDVDVHDNGTIDVHEKILAHFYDEKQGIMRKMPYKGNSQIQINGEWKTYYWDLEYSGIHANKEIKVWNEDGYTIIRLGTAGQYISGDVEYDIYYRVFGAFITENKEYDELYWNVIGTEWDVKIRNASFTIHFPDKVTDLENIDYRIYYGPEGSPEGGVGGRDIEGVIDGQNLTYTHDYSLNAYEGITFQVRLKKGFIALSQWQQFLRFLKNYWHYILSAFVFLASLLIWAKWGKDKRVTVMTEFFPPKEITPSEASSILLQNEKFDISPTLVDLARRGYIVIGKESNKTYVQIVKEPDDRCRSYEKTLLTSLADYANADNKVYTTDLEQTFYSDAAKVESMYGTQFRSKGFFEATGNMWRNIYIFISAAAIFFLVYALFTYDDPSKPIIFSIFTLVDSLVFAGIMPKKTGKGLDMYQKIKGFREFMSRAEKDKIERLCHDFPTYFDDTIPYAMVFGLAGRWGNMFDGLMKEPPNWYRSDYYHDHHFRTTDFIYHLQSSVGKISHSSYSTPPSSSGGSSGGSGWSGGGGSWGGSSGGGFGGGGGSSW
ncbi:MAG: hypothetical protein A2Y33_05565 [Spirochaetes bacterium GWF1_51_8]|nr:MAG: hypothetical protein A2Y33_05565 [Spirochaetes bacterium GWF1_51_8]